MNLNNLSTGILIIALLCGIVTAATTISDTDISVDSLFTNTVYEKDNDVGVTVENVTLENGYVQTGDGAPSIKTKYLTGTTAASSTTVITHGITSGLTKIIYVGAAIWRPAQNNYVSNGDPISAQWFGLFHDGTDIRLSLDGITNL